MKIISNSEEATSTFGEELNLQLETNMGSLPMICETAEQGRIESAALSRYQRREILLKVADKVRERAETFARLIVLESGKPIRQAKKEVRRCINTLTVSAEESTRLLGEVLDFNDDPEARLRQGYFEYHPLGIIFAIAPFNDPLNLVAHKLGPAIAAGNSVILKPSEKTPATAKALCECFYEAGLAKNIIQTIYGGPDIVRRTLDYKNIRMLSFTGGFKTAEALAKQAGLKKLLMDLGGNAPVIVDEKCDVDLALQESISGAFFASGQNCIGVQRIYVHASLYKSFAQEFAARTSKIKVGNPLLEASEMGPMVDENSAKLIEKKVESAVHAGAKVLCGHLRDGAYYQPTVLIDVPEQHPVYIEEAFAPLVIIKPFEHFQDAINMANKAEALLHAAIFTNDISRAMLAADKLEAGGVMINDSSDYRLDSMPFGGFKYGSLGREGVKFAMLEMSQPKVKCIAM